MRMTESDWSNHKELLQELFLVQKRTVEQVREHMNEVHGLSASKQQYERIFKKWSFTKNRKRRDWEDLARTPVRDGINQIETNASSNNVGEIPSPEKVRRALLRYRARPTLAARWFIGPEESIQLSVAAQLIPCSLPTVAAQSTLPTQPAQPAPSPQLRYQTKHSMRSSSQTPPNDILVLLKRSILNAMLGATPGILQDRQSTFLQFVTSIPYEELEQLCWYPTNGLEANVPCHIPQQTYGNRFQDNHDVHETAPHTPSDNVEKRFDCILRPLGSHSFNDVLRQQQRNCGKLGWLWQELTIRNLGLRYTGGTLATELQLDFEKARDGQITLQVFFLLTILACLVVACGQYDCFAIVDGDCIRAFSELSRKHDLKAPGKILTELFWMRVHYAGTDLSQVFFAISSDTGLSMLCLEYWAILSQKENNPLTLSRVSSWKFLNEAAAAGAAPTLCHQHGLFSTGCCKQFPSYMPSRAQDEHTCLQKLVHTGVVEPSTIDLTRCIEGGMNVDMVASFLTAGALPEGLHVARLVNKYLCPLQAALALRNRDLSLLLLDHLTTPLGCSKDALRARLLDLNATINDHMSQLFDFRTPLSLALRFDIEIAERLIYLGADVNSSYIDELAACQSTRVFERAVERSNFASTPPKLNAFSPLQSAVETGSVEALQLLLTAGAHPDCSPGCPPLLLAVVKAQHEMVRLLLDHGAEPNIIGPKKFLHTAKTRWSLSPLAYAAASGRTDLMKILLSAGADPNFCDEEDSLTPLQSAIIARQQGSIDLLLAQRKILKWERGSKATEYELPCGLRPYYLAIETLNWKTVQLLAHPQASWEKPSARERDVMRPMVPLDRNCS